jgi:dihydroorotase
VFDVCGSSVSSVLAVMDPLLKPGAGYWGIDPDPVAWHSGVTTWVDAGSAGAYSLAGLRVFAATRQVRVPILVNIAAQGLAARTGESRDLANCDIDLAVDAVRSNRDVVRGIKVRIDSETVGDNGVEPLRRALTAAEGCGVPVMVHIATSPPPVDEVLELLRPGDVVTHCASGFAEAFGPAAQDAYERGVLFDIGHGSGGFAFDVLERQLAAGLRPHTVSTDLHARSLYGPAFDLPTTMTKLLAAGLDLADVVAAATVGPARVLGLDAGTLTVGAPADIAVFALHNGPFDVVDAHRQVRHAPVRLVNEATYVFGRPLRPQLPAAPPPWIPLTDDQREALRRRERAVREMLSTPLVGRDGLAEQFPRS